jgi:tRNA-dihydrouridine synthase B
VRPIDEKKMKTAEVNDLLNSPVQTHPLPPMLQKEEREFTDFIKPLQIGSLTLSNPLLLSPLSGISDPPFRLLAKEQGCALTCTEMISAESLLHNPKSGERFFHRAAKEHPLAVQIFGSRPSSMAEAGRIIQDWGAEILDINMGCPARKVVHNGSGAALLKDIKMAAEIIQSVRKAISIPLTVKIRSGWDEKNLNYLEIAKVAEESGIDALTIHGRTKSQGYRVRANWEIIRKTKEHLRIPVVGNGDLSSPEAVLDFFAQTGCSGAMIGRGALGNPWIFSQTIDLLHGRRWQKPSLDEKESVLLRHLNLVREWRGEEHGLKEFRKHLIWYTRGFPGSSDFRAQIPYWRTVNEMRERVQNYFQNLRLLPLSA